MGIKVLGPDVNEGFGKFSVISNGNIRFGMSSIKGVGENVVNSIVEERKINGPYNNLFDLAARLDSKSINKKSVEGLALSGAFDSFENIHRAMFFNLDKDGTTLTDKMIKFGNQKNLGNDSSQSSLFSEENEIEVFEPKLPEVEKWTAIESLSREKEVVGFFISGHPLDPYKAIIDHRCNINCAQLKAGLELYKNKEVVFCGIVSGFEIKIGKNGDPYGKISIEDYFGFIDLMLYRNDYIDYNKFMVKGIFVYVKANIQPRYKQPDSLEIKLNKIELLETV
jgi:DNA polymerase-3 subunit alpha